MVYLSGSEISSGFTDGTSVVAIYTYGCQVWPSEESWNGSGIGPEVHPGDYYISWTPSDASGVFSIAGRNYRLEDYGGYFNDFDGVITSHAFESLPITTLETNAVKVEYRAFNSCGFNMSGISQVSMSYCSWIGEEAFRYAGVESLCLPKCTWISKSAFYHNGLTYLSLPECTYIGKSAFTGCRALHNIKLSICSQIDSYAFQSISDNVGVKLGYSGVVARGVGAISYITTLTVPAWLELSYRAAWAGALDPGLTPAQRIYGYHYLSIPELSYYGESSYGRMTSGLMKPSYSNISYFETDATGLETGLCEGFSNLVSVYMPHYQDISGRVFCGCSKLKYITTSEVSYIYGRAFEGCKSIEYMNLPSATNIYGTGAFSGCTNLSYIMFGLGIPSLMSRSLCLLEYSDIFNGCTNLQAIYVPSQYYSNYINDSKWSWYSDIIISYSI